MPTGWSPRPSPILSDNPATSLFIIEWLGGRISWRYHSRRSRISRLWRYWTRLSSLHRTWLIFEPSKMWSHPWSRLPSNQREPRWVHPLHPGRSVFIRDCSFRRSSIGWSLVGQARWTQESNWAAWKNLSSRRSTDAQIRSECAETDVHSQDFTVFWKPNSHQFWCASQRRTLSNRQCWHFWSSMDPGFTPYQRWGSWHT